MKKIVRITESDLQRIVKRVMEESDVLPAKLSSSYKSLVRAWDEENGEDENIDRRTKSFFKNLGDYSSSKVRESLFRKLEDKYGKLPNHIRKQYKRIYNLDESDITRFVKRVIKENEVMDNYGDFNYDINTFDCGDKVMSGTVDIDEDGTIMINYCRGNEVDLEYLKEKGRRLIGKVGGNLY